MPGTAASQGLVRDEESGGEDSRDYAEGMLVRLTMKEADTN